MRVIRRRETWRDVPGYEGFYQVSDLGRVRSYPNSRGKGMTVLKPQTHSGYHKYTLCKDGKQWQTTAHVLVLTTFVGPAPEGFVGCHGNGDRGVNALWNLRWDTQSANLNDRHVYGESGGIGEGHGNAKLTENDVREMRALLANGSTPKEMAARYGITAANVYMIRSRKAWAHL